MIGKHLIKTLMRYLVKSQIKRQKKKKIKKISICLGLPANEWLNIPKIGSLSLLRPLSYSFFIISFRAAFCGFFYF